VTISKKQEKKSVQRKSGFKPASGVKTCGGLGSSVEDVTKRKNISTGLAWWLYVNR
jgi:hypothetical protein